MLLAPKATLRPAVLALTATLPAPLGGRLCALTLKGHVMAGPLVAGPERGPTADSPRGSPQLPSHEQGGGVTHHAHGSPSVSQSPHLHGALETPTSHGKQLLAPRA